MGIDRKTIVQRLLVVIGILVLIPVFALGALAVSARFSDGPSVIFSGGPLVAGELVTGPERFGSWSMKVNSISILTTWAALGSAYGSGGRRKQNETAGLSCASKVRGMSANSCALRRVL